MAELHLSRHSKPLWLLFGESADPFIPSFAAVGLCIVTFGTRGLVLHGTGTNCSAVWKRELSLAGFAALFGSLTGGVMLP